MSLVPETKLSEILEPFKDENSVSVLELFKHLEDKFNSDKDYFYSLQNHMVNVSDSDSSVLKAEDSLLSSTQPFGELGETTFNQAAVYFRNLELEKVFNTVQVSVNVVPLVTNLIGFRLLLKSYMKYVHNRPYRGNISVLERMTQESIRNRQLTLFLCVGAPALL
jgi:hypothetical protein